MIRFIDLTDQILEDEFCFAWFNTVTDTFIELGSEQVWHSWNEFEKDYLNLPNNWGTYKLDRFRGLFPKEVNQQHRGATAAAGGSEI